MSRVINDKDNEERLRIADRGWIDATDWIGESRSPRGYLLALAFAGMATFLLAVML